MLPARSLCAFVFHAFTSVPGAAVQCDKCRELRSAFEAVTKEDAALDGVNKAAVVDLRAFPEAKRALKTLHCQRVVRQLPSVVLFNSRATVLLLFVFQPRTTTV